jgi:peroxiredoxin
MMPSRSCPPFAETHGIGFSLVSDEGSVVVRKLGLVNERVQDDHAVYGIARSARHVNLPYPGVFVLDETGTITHKRFHESYRERDTGAGLIAETLGILAGVAARPQPGTTRSGFERGSIRRCTLRSRGSI